MTLYSCNNCRSRLSKPNEPCKRCNEGKAEQVWPIKKEDWAIKKTKGFNKKSQKRKVKP